MVRRCTDPSIHLSLDEDTLNITVGCRLFAYPSIHFFVSRSRSVLVYVYVYVYVWCVYVDMVVRM